MPDKIKITKCRLLPPRGKIGIAATGSPVQPGRLAAGIARLEDLGFQVEAPLDPAKYYGNYDHGFTNGSPQDRAAALMQLINDPSVDAIIAARGGYGTLDVLPLLDYGQIKQNRKVIVGYSDVTVLLAAIHRRTGLTVVHGPTVSKEFAEFGDSADAQSDVAWLLALLGGGTSGLAALSCAPLGRDSDSSAAGPAIPGNLTMFQTLLGTPWDIPFDGAVVVLEEVGEQPYRVHRALTQLSLAGKFERAAGVVFGRFSKCDSQHGPALDDVLLRSSRDLIPPHVPVFSGLPFGHNGANRAVPFGTPVRIQNGKFEIVDSPVS